DGTDMVWEVWLNSDGKVALSVALNAQSSNVDLVTSPDAVNDGNWHHIVVTVDFTEGQAIYVDGSQVVNRTAVVYSLRTNADPISLGADYLLHQGYFAGSLDDVAVYGVALSASQVAAHYALRTSGGTGGSGSVKTEIAPNSGSSRSTTLTVAGQTVS